MADKPRDRFMDFLTRLVRVPKHEIDQQERTYQKSKDGTEDHAKPRRIVPIAKDRSA